MSQTPVAVSEFPKLTPERTIEYGHEYPHTQEHLEHPEGSENDSSVSSRS